MLARATTEFSAGTLRFRSPEPLGMDDGFVRTGYALGRTIVMGPDAGVGTWRHELIHFVQSLQLASNHTGIHGSRDDSFACG
jgi:hypothetical protein